jgi:hypothetical protein
MAIKYINIFQSKDLKIFTKLGSWFENKPSGNPAGKAEIRRTTDKKILLLGRCKSDSNIFCLEKPDSFVQMIFLRTNDISFTPTSWRASL